MQRSTHHALLALALLFAACARTRESTSNPDAAASPPPTFLEAEPDNVDAPNQVTITPTEGLAITLRAKPLSLTGKGWGFELELEFRNQLVSRGVFDLGPEPMVTFSISVTLPDGSGFGSGGGCTFGSSLHGHKEQALGPGEQHRSRQEWMSGVESGQVLEAGINVCGIRFPDGDSLSGEIAKLEAVVNSAGQLEKFELRASAPPPRATSD